MFLHPFDTDCSRRYSQITDGNIWDNVHNSVHISNKSLVVFRHLIQKSLIKSFQNMSHVTDVKYDMRLLSRSCGSSMLLWRLAEVSVSYHL